MGRPNLEELFDAGFSKLQNVDPLLLKSDKSKMVSVRIPFDLLSDLQNMAEVEDRTVSNVIKKILILYFDKKHNT